MVEEAKVRGRGGAGFPAGTKWRFTRGAKGDEKFIVANGDEGDPGSYIDKYLMEQNPVRVLEGLALAGFAVGAGHGFVLTRSEYPLSKPALEAAAEQAREEGWLGTDIQGSGFDFDVTIVEGAGSYVVGEETALLACLQGLRGHGVGPAAVPGRARACTACPPWSTTPRRWPTCRSSPCTAPRPTRRSSPDSESNGSKLVCFNERFVRPQCLRGPVRDDDARAVRGRRRGPARRALDQGGPDRRAAGRDPARVQARHAV